MSFSRGFREQMLQKHSTKSAINQLRILSSTVSLKMNAGLYKTLLILPKTI